MFVWLLLIGLLAFGHLALWIAAFNRTHSLPIPSRWVRYSELMQILAAVSILALMIRSFWEAGVGRGEWWGWPVEQKWLVPYGIVCLVMAMWTAGHWLRRQWLAYRPQHVVSNDTQTLDIAKRLERLPVAGLTTSVFARLPMNQMFELCVNVKTLRMPQLPPELHGLTITHLSDLHFSGRITREFFEEVVEEARQLDGDLVVVTGDIQESESCYDWLPTTLGRLEGRQGVYFILGNHDRRMRDVGRLRRELVQLGLIDLGTGIHQFRMAGSVVRLAGNELPWFGPPVELPPRDPHHAELRILLSHSPDQIHWARQRGFDLMLAGHTHGGHIRIPGIGPIVCPSRYGVKYAAGVFYEDPTLMHVIRGISGLDPVRFNCPPELTKLVLHAGNR